MTQRRLRPSQGGKFLPPVKPSIELVSQIRAEEFKPRQPPCLCTWKRYLGVWCALADKSLSVDEEVILVSRNGRKTRAKTKTNSILVDRKFIAPVTVIAELPRTSESTSCFQQNLITHFMILLEVIGVPSTLLKILEKHFSLHDSGLVTFLSRKEPYQMARAVTST